MNGATAPSSVDAGRANCSDWDIADIAHGSNRPMPLSAPSGMLAVSPPEHSLVLWLYSL